MKERVAKQWIRQQCGLVRPVVFRVARQTMPGAAEHPDRHIGATTEMIMEALLAHLNRPQRKILFLGPNKHQAMHIEVRARDWAVKLGGDWSKLSAKSYDRGSYILHGHDDKLYVDPACILDREMVEAIESHRQRHP